MPSYLFILLYAKKNILAKEYAGAFQPLIYISTKCGKANFWCVKKVVLIALEYSLDIQAQISVALCAIHNFICAHDPNEDPLAEISNFFEDGIGSTDDTDDSVLNHTCNNP